VLFIADIAGVTPARAIRATLGAIRATPEATRATPEAIGATPGVTGATPEAATSAVSGVAKREPPG
jgi:hypothetical protein